MNVFLFEIRRQRNAIIAWSASLSIVLLFFMSLFPMFSSSAANFKDILKNYPEWLLSGLNMQIDKMTTIFGYFPFALTYTALIGAIGAAYFGMGMLSRENREKTADFLLSKPATRVSVITQKLLAVLASLVIINAVFVPTSICWCLIFAKNSFDAGTLALMSLTLFFMQLVFAAIGAFVAVFFRKIKSVLSVALAAGFGFFLLDLFDKVLNDAADAITGTKGHNVLRYISPTKYFDYAAIADHHRYSATPFITLAVVLILLIGASVIRFRRQDTHSVV